MNNLTINKKSNIATTLLVKKEMFTNTDYDFLNILLFFQNLGEILQFFL